MKVIAIYHKKGGVGKTTIAVNLAAALRNRGHSVLLIDLDSQVHSTFATGLVKFQFEEDDNLRDKNVYHVLGVLPSKISTNRRAFDKTFPRQKETIMQHYNFTILDSIIFKRIALSHSVN